MNQRLLTPGGTIAIVSPSGLIGTEYLDGGIRALTDMGYKTELMPNAMGPATSVFAADDARRAADLAEALSRPDIDIVWCTRGGYGAMRTLAALDAFGGWKKLFANTDKLIVGFSDITALHAAAATHGHAAIHGPMLKHLATHDATSPDIVETLRAVTEGRADVSCRPLPGSRTGETRGRLIGGNLSILYSLLATDLCPSPDGAILFIEDLSEYRYHIDRMIQALRFSGFLSRLAGIVVGQMTGMRDGATPFGRTAYEIIADATADYPCPVLLGFPAGHDPAANYPLILGGDAVLSVGNSEATLSMSLAR